MHGTARRPARRRGAGAFDGIFGATIACKWRRTVRLPGNALAFLSSLEGSPECLVAAAAFFQTLAVSGVVRERGCGEDVGDDTVDGVIGEGHDGPFGWGLVVLPARAVRGQIQDGAVGAGGGEAVALESQGAEPVPGAEPGDDVGANVVAELLGHFVG